MATLSRLRYEVFAVAVAVLASLTHLWVEAQPAVGFLAPDQQTVSVNPVARALLILEGRATDVKFRLRRERQPHPAVVVVAIDERSAQRYGLWPWPRRTLAQALTNLLDAGVAAIGLDIAMTDEARGEDALLEDVAKHLEAEPELPATLASYRDELKQRAAVSGDDALEAALRRGGDRIVQSVIPYGEGDLKDFPETKLAEHAKILEPVLIRRVAGLTKLSFYEIPIETLPLWKSTGASTPLPRFAAAGNRLGHFSMVPDHDGTIRRMAILAKVQGRATGLLPAMAVQVAAAAKGAEVLPAWEEGGVLRGVALKKQDDRRELVPMEDSEPYMLINYPGDANGYSRLSIADVIDGTFDKAALAGKVVLVGVTVVGLTGDQRVTPFKELEPGVFTNAAVVSNILSGRYLKRTYDAVALECFLMLLLGLVLAVAIPRIASFTLKAATITGVVLAWLVLDQLAFELDVQIATVTPLLSLLVTSFGTVFLGYLSVDREKLKLRGTFSRYLNADVMELALASPERLNKGEKREMTVMFSDIRGFTTLSERMGPEQLASFINEYLSPMTQIVFDEKGTLDKYIGDAVMAFWNAPLDQPDHALRACRAALTMLERLEELKATWRANGYPELEIGIGINTGPMVVGNMGSDVRVDYTVLGDSVNLGARLEGTNKEYETHVILSEFTWEQVKGQVVGRRLGAVRVKGKRQPVAIYELRGLGKPEGDEAKAIAAFESGVEAFVARKFDEARAKFEEVLTLWKGDYPARRYLADLEGFAADPPPPDWDGVVSLKTK